MSGKKGEDRQGKEKKFLELPEYPGGKSAFQEFIKKNLRYPKEAQEHRVQGTVHVRHWVDGNGKVVDAEVTHGIGYGCDEEALRLVRLLKYGKVKNRGVKLKAAMRTRIEFKLPPQPSFSYSISTKKGQGQGQGQEQDQEQKKKQDEGEGTRIGNITYTITPKKS